MSDGFMNIQHFKVSSDWLLFSRIIFCSNMNFEMFYKIPFLLVSFVALVALEWSLPRVRPRVPLQITRRSASIVALVTLERPLSWVLPHHVIFQVTRLNARIIAWSAPVWLFTRVRLLVTLQAACSCCIIITLIALVKIAPGVPLDMRFEDGNCVAWKVALWAIVRFFPGVN